MVRLQGEQRELALEHLRATARKMFSDTDEIPLSEGERALVAKLTEAARAFKKDKLADLAAIFLLRYWNARAALMFAMQFLGEVCGDSKEFAEFGQAMAAQCATFEEMIDILETELAQRVNEAQVRAKKAADASHEGDRKKKVRAREIWQSKTWRVQADAERKIASECHITQVVAGRWIRKFKNPTAGNSAVQSKDSAKQSS